MAFPVLAAAAGKWDVSPPSRSNLDQDANSLFAVPLKYDLPLLDYNVSLYLPPATTGTACLRLAACR